MKYIIVLFATLLISVANTKACYALTPATNDTVYIELDPLFPEEFDNQDVSIFINWAYSGYEPSDFKHMLSEDWYDFSKDEETNIFSLTKSDISIGKDYNDCLQDSITYVSSANNILMIKGLTQKEKHPKAIMPEVNALQPGEKIDFTFNNQKYTLRGEGIVPQQDKVYLAPGFSIGYSTESVINYKLYLSTNGKEQLLLSIPTFNDTFVQILFIGDLDEDGKPDFVFDTSRDYEERRVTLFLSSPAIDNEIVRAIDEANNQFDC